MRPLPFVLAATLVTAGCATNSYRISNAELSRLVTVPPQARGQSVRVDQEIHEADAPPAERVDGSTEVIFIPNFNIGSSIRYDHPTSGGGGTGGKLGGGKAGPAGSGKDAAIAVLIIAAVALVAVAAIEGSRFDGNVNLHPMHPVHLFGKDGGYTVVPLAWLDPTLTQWADHGIVRSTEGPFRELDRAPLWRQGPTYAMYGGSGSLESVAGDKAAGPAFLIQGGYFPTEQLGVVASVFFGWRDNRVQQTLYESRYMLELHYLPIAIDPLHLGLFGGAGFAYRWEDGLPGGNSGSTALTGGALFELAIHTRIALTARLGITHAHGERMTDALVGLAVY